MYVNLQTLARRIPSSEGSTTLPSSRDRDRSGRLHHSSRQKGAERGPSLLLALQGKPPARARVSPFNPSRASSPATDSPPPPKGCSSPAAPSPLTPWSAVAAAATSGPKAPKRFAPGAQPPRTSARPPAKAAAAEAAAVVVAAPPPRPPEPPTRTSPNRGRGGFVTQAGQGWTRACLAHCLRPWSRVLARAAASRSPR